MSTLAEKAAARRAKVLARAKSGNSVTAAIDGSSESLDGAASVEQETALGSNSTSSFVPEITSLDDKKINDPLNIAESSFVSDEIQAINEPNSPPKSIDAILAEAEQEIFSSPVASSEEQPKSVTRPLAERRKRIAKARLSDVKGEEDDTTDNAGVPQVAASDNEHADEKAEPSTPVQFISKSAREVEIEIASMTKRSDAAVLGKELTGDAEIYEVVTPSVSADADDNEPASTSSKPIRSLRDKLQQKKAARKEANQENSTGDSQAADKTSLLRAQKISELATGKITDPSAIPRFIRLVMLLSLGIFSGYLSYAGNRTDALNVLQRKVTLHKEHVQRAHKANVMKTSAGVGADANSAIDNNDQDIDQWFDERASRSTVSSTSSWTTGLRDSAHNLLLNSAIGPYYTASRSYLHSPNEGFNELLLESVYRPAFHRRSTDSLTSAELESGMQYQVGDAGSTEGCTKAWSDTAVVAIMGAWVLSTATSNLLKAVKYISPAPPKKESNFFSTIWNFFTSDFDLMDYLYETIYAICGELSLFWLVSFLVASTLIRLEQIGTI